LLTLFPQFTRPLFRQSGKNRLGGVGNILNPISAAEMPLGIFPTLRRIPETRWEYSQRLFFYQNTLGNILKAGIFVGMPLGIFSMLPRLFLWSLEEGRVGLAV